jgi:hypothetical protein
MRWDDEGVETAARRVVAAMFMGPDGERRLFFWDGRFVVLESGLYRLVEDAEFRAKVYRQLDRESLHPNRRKVNSVISALRRISSVSVLKGPERP